MLAPCALQIGPLCHWTPGAATLLLFAIPVSLSGLCQHVWALRVTTLLAVASCFIETWLAGHPLTLVAMSQHVFPLSTSILLFSIGSIVQFHAKIVRLPMPKKSLFEAVPQDTETVAAYEMPRPVKSVAELIAQAESMDMPGLGDTKDLQRELEAEDPELLLALQEVGWRVASDLDLTTLYQTVGHTTQRLLRCKKCVTLLWSGPANSLSDPLVTEPDRQTVPLYVDRGMTGWVIKNRHLLIRADVESDPALKHLRRPEEQHIDAIAPLAVAGELIGLLVLEGVDTATPQFHRMLQLLANVSALAIKNARLFQRIAEMARHDGLTGLLNHASFQERLRELVDQAQCDRKPLTLIMSDIDSFKSINDAYGHPVGDHVLREVARTWQKVVPEDAIVARYGGEEFVCAISGMSLERASDLAEALRNTIETLPLSFEKGILTVTASFGVAELGQPARNATELIRLADDALYQSKRGGRNRVTLVPPSMCVAGRQPGTIHSERNHQLQTGVPPVLRQESTHGHSTLGHRVAEHQPASAPRLG
jgi:diguanylate cyclase (GGDEF)-like protein